MKDKDKLRIDRAYRAVANKNPEVTNPRLLELLTRDYLMRQAKLKAALVFLAGIASIFIGAALTGHPLLKLFGGLLALAGLVLLIVGVCKFVKALHDPLTPNEAKELAAYDAAEKGVRTNVDLSQYDYSSYTLYQQQKYEEASPFGKLLFLLKRIPLFVYFFIFMFLLFGILSVNSGIHNIKTYDERNKNAVEVQAAIVRFEPYLDNDGDTQYHVYWKYTYNGTAYTYKGSSYSTSMAIGDTKSILIDSENPGTVIANDGGTYVLVGSILIAVALFLLIYGLIRAKQIEKPLSIFSFFWLIFVGAAIGFGAWGIYMLMTGDILLGLLVTIIGIPLWLLGAFLFHAIFN